MIKRTIEKDNLSVEYSKEAKGKKVKRSYHSEDIETDLETFKKESPSDEGFKYHFKSKTAPAFEKNLFLRRSPDGAEIKFSYPIINSVPTTAYELGRIFGDIRENKRFYNVIIESPHSIKYYKRTTNEDGNINYQYQTVRYDNSFEPSFEMEYDIEVANFRDALNHNRRRYAVDMRDCYLEYEIDLDYGNEYLFAGKFEVISDEEYFQEQEESEPFEEEPILKQENGIFYNEYDEVVDFPYTNIFNLFIKPYLDYIEKSVEFSIRNFPRINNELYDLDDRVASIGYSDVSFSKDKPLTIGKILKKYLKKSSQA